MFKNVASQKLTVFAFDATTNLPKSGDAANLTASVQKDDGSVTALADSSATEQDATNAKGYYTFDLAQGETNADKLLFSAKSSTANIVVIALPAVIYTVPPYFSSQAIDASGRVDVGKVLGTAQTARDLGANLDTAVSSRLASSSYSPPLDAGETRGALGLAAANLDLQLLALGNLDTAVSSRMATFSYTAPDNSGIAAVKAKTDALPADPASNTEVATRAAPGDAMALTAGERTTLTTALFAFVTEGTETFLGAVRLIRAALLGRSDGFPEGPVHFRDEANTKNRITASTDADGNRTAISTDAT